MQAGKLRNQVVLIRRSAAVNDIYGTLSETWLEVDTVWAMVEELTGRDLYQAQQVTPEVNTRFTIRHRTDIINEMRIIHNGTYYDIFAPVDIDGRKKYLAMTAKSIVSRSVPTDPQQYILESWLDGRPVTGLATLRGVDATGKIIIDIVWPETIQGGEL